MNNSQSREDARRLARVISAAGSKPDMQQAADDWATVVSVDDGVARVALAGGEEVDAALLVAAREGERVRVRMASHEVQVVGNLSSPPTDDGYAEIAHAAADRALASADEAQASADEAQASARSANGSAAAALYQLSVVQDVAGTAEWLAGHASYAATADTAVVAGKTYYGASGGTYLPQTVPDWTYTPTADTEPAPDKDYYIASGGSYELAEVGEEFEAGVSYYERAATNPSALGLYEANCSETIERYIASHLALTDEGLYLFQDGSEFRLRLSANGWELLDADGEPATATLTDGQGHVTSTIGRLDGLHLSISESRLSFSYPNGDEMVEVAWIEVDPLTGISSFHIANVVVMRELRLGSWKWYESASGALSLKWIGA